MHKYRKKKYCTLNDCGVLHDLQNNEQILICNEKNYNEKNDLLV